MYVAFTVAVSLLCINGLAETLKLPTCGELSQPIKPPKPVLRNDGKNAKSKDLVGSEISADTLPWMVEVYKGEARVGVGVLIENPKQKSGTDLVLIPSTIAPIDQAELKTYSVVVGAQGEGEAIQGQFEVVKMSPEQPNRANDDFVVLKISNLVTYGAAARPICLPSSSQEIGPDALLAGPGNGGETTEDGQPKKSVTLTLARVYLTKTNKKCEKVAGRNEYFCTMGYKSKDVGSPLMVVDKKAVLQAMVSGEHPKGGIVYTAIVPKFGAIKKAISQLAA